MQRRSSSPTSSIVALVEPLEARRLFDGEPWSQHGELIGQDDATTSFGSLTGAGQTIAIIDTGVDYTHPGLGGGFGPGHKVIAGYDFVDDDPDPLDTYGHGTHVAGMLAADSFTHSGRLHRGVAPDAKIVALRVDETNEPVPDERIEAALKWVLDNRSTYGITVANI